LWNFPILASNLLPYQLPEIFPRQKKPLPKNGVVD